MLPENVPLMSVVAAFCVIEPSLELRVTVALGTGVSTGISGWRRIAAKARWANPRLLRR